MRRGGLSLVYSSTVVVNCFFMHAISTLIQVPVTEMFTYEVCTVRSSKEPK